MTTIDTQEPSEITTDNLHECHECEVRFFALGILYKAPENVRKAKSTQMSDDELEASIVSQGLICPLLVYEDIQVLRYPDTFHGQRSVRATSLH